MSQIDVSYIILENGNVLLKNVFDPERNKLVEVEMRDLRYDEIQILQAAQKSGANVVDETYRLLACIVVKWDNDEAVTTLELKSKGFKVYRLLEGALQEFFLPEFNFKAI